MIYFGASLDKIGAGAPSTQLTPDQVDRLSAIAEAFNRALKRNPRDVFLVK